MDAEKKNGDRVRIRNSLLAERIAFLDRPRSSLRQIAGRPRWCGDRHCDRNHQAFA
jgi:hypothetical protein